MPLRSRTLTALALALGPLLAACATPATAARPSVIPIEEGFVDNGGVLLYFESVGRGPPLVVVHGGPGASHDYLLPNLYRLASRYRLVFLVGDHDQSDPAMSREMNAKIAGSRLVVLPNSGHMTFVDQPDQFIQAITDFVR